jgi:hypothetical protein
MDLKLSVKQRNVCKGKVRGILYFFVAGLVTRSQVLQPVSSTQVFLVALYFQSATEIVLKFYVATS